MEVKVRMAPSPTGEYHIGHIRTALYNWAYARKTGGTFLLRIEDTDRSRFIEGAADKIMDVLHKYGLAWDEGPYYQSERLDIYKKYALELVEKGYAYYCFCSQERLGEMRKTQQAQGVPTIKYDRHCLALSPEEVSQKLQAGEPYVIRLKVPDNEDIVFEDKVFGTISINTNDIDDQVLLKSDGFPTYHLAVVVDDHLMNVTHVMRGNDWLPSTPKHIILYKAFGWESPEYVHLPNLKEKGQNRKLSKRFGSVYAVEFLKEGYLPEAIMNFLMFLGWNPGTEKEIYSLEEFVEDFSIEKIHKTDLVAFDREKLLWINGVYIRNKSVEELLLALNQWAREFKITLVSEGADEAYVLQVLRLVQERMKLFNEYNSLVSYFYLEPELSAEMLTKYTKDMITAKKTISGFIELFSREDNWEVDILDKVSHDYIAREDTKPKAAFMTLRIAVTGSEATPPIFDVLAAIGKDKTLKRLNNALAIINSS